MDGTFVIKLVRCIGREKLFSYDLKSATDRFPVEVQAAPVVQCFGGRFADDVVGLLLTNVAFEPIVRK